jgi:hypothetical protein
MLLFPLPSRLRVLRRLLLVSAALASLVAWPLHATSVTPPTFPALVDRAGSVFRGEVIAQRAELVTRGADRAIFTHVTFRVVEVLKGTPAAVVTLEFLGGTVGELTLDVAGMPQFTVGRQEIVFVENAGPQICPLVAMSFGRYRIQRDAAGTEFVARDNGAPLISVDEIALPLTSPAIATLTSRLALAGARPLTPADFGGQVRREVTRKHTP